MNDATKNYCLIVLISHFDTHSFNVAVFYIFINITIFHFATSQTFIHGFKRYPHRVVDVKPYHKIELLASFHLIDFIPIHKSYEHLRTFSCKMMS